LGAAPQANTSEPFQLLSQENIMPRGSDYGPRKSKYNSIIEQNEEVWVW